MLFCKGKAGQLYEHHCEVRTTVSLTIVRLLLSALRAESGDYRTQCYHYSGTKPDHRGATTKAVLEDKQHSLCEHVCQRFSFSASKIGIQFSYYPRKRECWLMFHKSIGGFHTWSLEGWERVPFPPQPVTHPMTVTPQCGIILRLSAELTGQNMWIWG